MLGIYLIVQVIISFLFPHLRPHSPRKSAAENLQFAAKTYQIIFKRKTSSPVESQEKWLSEDIFPNVQVNWEKKLSATIFM